MAKRRHRHAVVSAKKQKGHSLLSSLKEILACVLIIVQLVGAIEKLDIDTDYKDFQQGIHLES